MIAATVESTAVYLVLDPPDWGTPFEVIADVPGETSRGLTGREARRSWGETLRLTLSFTLLLNRAGITRWRNAWQERQNEPLLVPFWPGAVSYASYATSPFVGGKAVLLTAAGVFAEIFTGTTASGSPAAGAVAVPLLWCRPKSAPNLTQRSTELAEIALEVVEDGPAAWAMTIPSGTLQYGPALGTAPNERVWPVLPLLPDWVEPPTHGLARIETDVEQLGTGRGIAAASYIQAPRRSLTWTGGGGDNADAARLLRWLLAGRGVTPAWSPTWFAEVRLAIPAVATDESIIVSPEPEDVFATNRYLAFCRPGQVPYIAEIDGFDDHDIDLVAALPSGQSWPVRDTVLTTAALCRLRLPRISLSWTAPSLWRASVELVEVPPEYFTPSGETHGETFGVLPAHAHLITLTLAYPTTTVTHRWTDYEDDIAMGEDSYIARKIGVTADGLRQSLALDRSRLRLRGRVWPGCPLVGWLSGIEAVAHVSIARVEVVDGTPGDLAPIFSGRVNAVSWEGAFFEVQVDGTMPWFRPCPRLLMQQGCNHALFDSQCGLDADDYECKGTVVAVSNGGLSIALADVATVISETTPQDGAGRIPLGWFAGGWMRFGTGAAAQHRIISGSPQGGAEGDTVTLVIQRAFSPAPAETDTVHIWPGCDGRVSTCTGKFANLSRFGGFPFMPHKSPSFQPLKKSPTRSGKK
jgi:uncharacterized phage protein (TIGR02218 family)